MVKIRVIGGKYGSRSLDTPPGHGTHPMGERVRNALFNSIGGEIVDARVLDIFAGSGALGLEALSRGAAHVTFVEKDRVASKILQENIDSIGVQRQSKVIQTAAGAWLETQAGGQFDIILADPPYHNPQFSTVKKLFALLKPNALMVLSHPGRGEVPISNASINGIVVVDNRSYGNAFLTFYRQVKDED